MQRAGRRRLAQGGETVQLAYVDQSRTLDGSKSAWEEISGGQEQIMVGKKEINSRAYLSSFNFKGTDQQKKSARSRVASAIGCISPGRS